MKEISEQEKMVEKSDTWDEPKKKELMERYIKYREDRLIPEAYKQAFNEMDKRK
jgi:hypothetical protein